MKIKKKFSHNRFIWWYKALNENSHKPKLVQPTKEQEEILKKELEKSKEILKKGEQSIEKRKSKKISRQENFQTYCKQN